jgi:hypothetical protein
MSTARLAPALLLAALQASAAAAPPEPSRPLDQVTVEAHRQALEARVTTYVQTLAHVDREESLKRWKEPMCPLVAGLAQAQGEFMLARISDIARRAAVPLGDEHCRPNFYIVATADPEELLKAWKQRDRKLYGGAMPGQVKRFLDQDRPVRVWYNASFAAGGGGPLDPQAPEVGIDFVPTNHQAKATRLQFNDIMVFGSVIVVINLRRVQGLKYGQLTDYVAMVGLAQPDTDADLGGAPSILQLFGVQPPQPLPAGLSDWDVQFLRALYTTEQTSFTQRNQIIQMMMRELPP